MRENIILHLKNISFYLKANKKKKNPNPQSNNKSDASQVFTAPSPFSLGKGQVPSLI